MEILDQMEIPDLMEIQDLIKTRRTRDTKGTAEYAQLNKQIQNLCYKEKEKWLNNRCKEIEKELQFGSKSAHNKKYLPNNQHLLV